MKLVGGRELKKKKVGGGCCFAESIKREMVLWTAFMLTDLSGK